MRREPETQFQFHIGSIKTRQKFNEVFEKEMFQFHIGSIKTTGSINLLRRYGVFQFHIGSIKTKTCLYGFLRRCWVSIPHWFD